MRTPHADIIAAIESGSLSSSHLITVTVSGTTYYLTSFDRDLTTGGHTYTPTALRSGQISGDLVREASVELGDVDNTWSGRFLIYGAVGHALLIDFVYLNLSTWAVLGSPVRMFTGETNGARKNFEAGSISIFATNHRNKWDGVLPGLDYSAICRARQYRGNICQYVGDAITNISQAAAAVVSSTAHHFTVNDSVKFESVGGMTQINGLTGTVTVANPNDFTVDINSIAFSAYGAGGVAFHPDCPRSRAACQERGNELHMLAFPGLPREDETIYFGGPFFNMARRDGFVTDAKATGWTLQAPIRRA